jgi:hypothetical protein
MRKAKDKPPLCEAHAGVDGVRQNGHASGAPADSTEICARLNELEFEEVDFVPRLGAWGLHAPNDLPGYSCFIPSAEPLGGMHMILLWWYVRRAGWLRERFWAAKVGLRL